MTETTSNQAEESATPSTASVLQLPSAPQTRGRPLRTYATAERIRAALVEELPEILERVLSAARAGDMQAARLILDRAIAPLKPIEIPTAMNPVTGSLPEQGAQIIAAMTSGQITAGQ